LISAAAGAGIQRNCVVSGSLDFVGDRGIGAPDLVDDVVTTPPSAMSLLVSLYFCVYRMPSLDVVGIRLVTVKFSRCRCRRLEPQVGELAQLSCSTPRKFVGQRC